MKNFNTLSWDGYKFQLAFSFRTDGTHKLETQGCQTRKCKASKGFNSNVCC